LQVAIFLYTRPVQNATYESTVLHIQKYIYFFYVLLTVHLNIILVIDKINAKIIVLQ